MKLFLTRIVLKAKRFSDWLAAQVVFAILKVLGLLPVDTALDVTDRLARRIGQHTKRHALVQANLANAFPDKTEDEREAIAGDMWANMARLVAEYVFLDKIFDFDPERNGKDRVEVEGVEIFRDLLERPRPFIVFTAHTGSFELLPIAAATFGLDVTVLFRPPNNPYVAEKLFSARRTRSGALIPSHAGAAWHLAAALDRGQGVGMLVDQKFNRGHKTAFFDRPVRTNPLLAKLVRQFECDVFPARCIRLPGNRFRLEIEPAITVPRGPRGEVDVEATAQLLNDTVERWVREHPGQWQWFHDRWRIRKKLERGETVVKRPCPTTGSD
ncbi:lipid A biosynthesis lauroyl acyltransferase [Pararhizobium mangrovi]|uniref:Lipid A biosynthesis lauroyl acyltransferase n=1 Tax=Pararhizobium mangrovi TaxID=2590452 RepID=A0A506UDU5_9HYPH|nr:lipid A biosynthesis lauroyl acyltransferase [Pararhizobium mangrovi]TPW31301.1 lipid A biosynthesis lauroyl acyltransferase [Pararhizobium mangrovi]